VQKCKKVKIMIRVETYAELHSFVEGFVNDHFNTLVICSTGGLGKSEEVRRATTGQDVVRIGGHVTPLGLYERLYVGRNKPVIFDEIDELLSNPTHVGLLKQLCETRDKKTIMWGSKDRRAEAIDGGVGSFTTDSHVLVLCNSFTTLGANVAALKTRAMVLQFTPSAGEILDKMKTFAEDTEIMDFLERLHQSLPEFTLRTFSKLAELKAAGMDWRKYALDESSIPQKVLEIAELLVHHTTDTERLKLYSGSRRDYYNWKPDAEAHVRRQTSKGLGATFREAG
jgi:hypothetical protein